MASEEENAPNKTHFSNFYAENEPSQIWPYFDLKSLKDQAKNGGAIFLAKIGFKAGIAFYGLREWKCTQ